MTLDVQPRCTVNEVITLVTDWERQFLSAGEVEVFERLLQQCPQGGLCLIDHVGGVMPEGSIQIIDPEMRPGLKFMYQIVVRKRNDDVITKDDFQMMQTMRDIVTQRVEQAAEGYEDSTIFRVALSPPPGLQYTVSVQTGVGKHRCTSLQIFDCQLVLGSPYWISQGLNTRGITYSPQAVNPRGPPPTVCAHLARHSSGHTEWLARVRPLDSMTGFLGIMGVSPLFSSEPQCPGSSSDVISPSPFDEDLPAADGEKKKESDSWASGIFASKKGNKAAAKKKGSRAPTSARCTRWIEFIIYYYYYYSLVTARL